MFRDAVALNRSTISSECRSSSVQLERISHAAKLRSNHHAKYASNFFGRAPPCWRHIVCGRAVFRRGHGDSSSGRASASYGASCAIPRRGAFRCALRAASFSSAARGDLRSPQLRAFYRCRTCGMDARTLVPQMVARTVWLVVERGRRVVLVRRARLSVPNRGVR